MSVTRYVITAVALLCSTTVPASNATWDGFAAGIPGAQTGLQPTAPARPAPAPGRLAPEQAPAALFAPPAAPSSSLAPAQLPQGDPAAIFSLDTPGDPVATAETAEPAQPAGPDDRALRFYASQGDMARVAAEIRRIRLAHPGWEPPTDLFEPGRDDALERPLWALLEAERYVEIRQAVARIRDERPSWRPSNAFAAQYEERVARATIVAASEAGAHVRVVQAAQAAPNVLACRNMDLLWRVGEALARTGDAARAESLYAFVLRSCPDPQERVATVQKASATLDGAAVDRLAALGAARADGAGEFDEVVYGIVMGRVGEATADPLGTRADPQDLQRLADWAARRRDAAGMEVLGWYHHVVEKDHATAARFFREAMSYERSPKAVEGYALALRESGRVREAEEVTHEWRGADPLIEKLYVEIMAGQLTRPDVIDFPPDRLLRFEAAVLETENAYGAQAIGWLYYKKEDVEEARRWFTIAEAIEPDAVNTFGLALTAHELRDRETVLSLARRYGDRFPEVAEVATWTREARPAPQSRRAARRSGDVGGGAAARAVALYESGRYDAAVRALDAGGASVRRDHGLQVLRGWALYNSGNYEEARRQFARTHEQRPTRDTLYGMHFAQEKQLPTE